MALVNIAIIVLYVNLRDGTMVVIICQCVDSLLWLKILSLLWLNIQLIDIGVLIQSNSMVQYTWRVPKKRCGPPGVSFHQNNLGSNFPQGMQISNIMNALFSMDDDKTNIDRSSQQWTMEESP